MPRTSVALIGQVRAAGIDVPLLSADGWDDQEIVDASRQDAFSGIYFTTHRFLGVETPEMKAFVDAYKAKFGVAPPNAFAPLGYDTVNLLANAIERAKSAEPAQSAPRLRRRRASRVSSVRSPTRRASGCRKGGDGDPARQGTAAPVWTWMPASGSQ